MNELCSQFIFKAIVWISDLVKGNDEISGDLVLQMEILVLNIQTNYMELILEQEPLRPTRSF